MLRRTTLVAALLALLSSLAPAAGADAVSPFTCTFDPTTGLMLIQMDGTLEVRVRAEADGRIVVGPAVCAQDATTDTVARIDFEGRDHLALTIDQHIRPFAPGPIPDAVGQPEIKFEVGQGISLTSLTIFGGAGPEHIVAGADGIDLNADGDIDLRKDPDLMTVHGDGGGDSLSVGGDAVTGLAMPGRVWLDGDEGNDTLIGNGASVLAGGTGDDTITGVGPADAVSFADSQHGVKVNLGTGRAVGDGTDTVLGIDRAVGSPEGDVLIAGEAPVRMDGAGGDDLLVSGPGSDVLVGAAGRDTVSYAPAPRAVRVSLAGGRANWGDDTLVWIEGVRGSRFGDTLIGGASGDRLNGLGGDDTIRAGSGNDVLLGSLGNDILNGGLGRDRCLQGAGHGTRIDCEN